MTENALPVMKANAGLIPSIQACAGRSPSPWEGLGRSQTHCTVLLRINLRLLRLQPAALHCITPHQPPPPLAAGFFMADDSDRLHQFNPGAGAQCEGEQYG